MRTVRFYIINRPRQAIFYGLGGIFACLLILLVVNERNWRPLKGKTIYFELTDDTLAQLRDDGLSAALLTKLEGLKGQKYPTAEEFRRALQTTLNRENMPQAQSKILSVAWKTTWRASSNYSQEMAAFAVDGSFKTSWSSYAPMTFGMYFHVDLGALAVINGLVLRVGKNEQGQPVKWLVKTSVDGKRWQPILPRPHFTGEAMLVIPFAAVTARYVEIMQTSVAAAGPWYIYEFDVLRPIVPWQFERATGFFLLLGYVLTILPAVLLSGWIAASRRNLAAVSLSTLVLLIGWGAAAQFYQAGRREKALTPLLETIRMAPTDCKRIAVFEPEVPKSYPALAALNPDVVEFAELQRFGAQGIFWPYFVSSLKAGENPERAAFLERYYTAIWQNSPSDRGGSAAVRNSPPGMGRGGSAAVALYALRDPVRTPRQRYTWRELFWGTGRHLEDTQSESRIVRVATETDRPGLLTFGPFCQVCAGGRHVARFALRSNGKTEDVVAILEVVANTYDSIARLPLKGTDFADAAAYQTFDVPFELDLTENPAFQAKQLQFIVHFPATAEVRVDYIELDP